MNVAAIMRPILRTMFSLGDELVRSGVYVRPVSFAPSTGTIAAAEVSVDVDIFIGAYRPRELGSVVIQPGDEKVFIQASQLTNITDPAEGDYIIEDTNSLRRNVIGLPRLDSSELLWTLQTQRSLDQDWGGLEVATDDEDYGDLTLATSVDDRGAVP